MIPYHLKGMTCTSKLIMPNQRQTVKELRAIAKDRKIAKYYKMSRGELLEALGMPEEVPSGGKCNHGRRKVQCKDCMGSQICPHLRQKACCKECGGKGICTHDRVKYSCKDCGGSQVCSHGKTRYRCKECGGKGICEHYKRKDRCKDCRRSYEVTVI